MYVRHFSIKKFFNQFGKFQSFTSINKSVPMIMVESDNKNDQTRINIEQGSQQSLNSQPNKKSANGWTTMVMIFL